MLAEGVEGGADVVAVRDAVAEPRDARLDGDGEPALAEEEAEQGDEQDDDGDEGEERVPRDARRPAGCVGCEVAADEAAYEPRNKRTPARGRRPF